VQLKIKIRRLKIFHRSNIHNTRLQMRKFKHKIKEQKDNLL